MEPKQAYEKVDLTELYDKFTYLLYDKTLKNRDVIKDIDCAEDIAIAFDVPSDAHKWLCDSLNVTESNTPTWYYLKGVCDQYYEVWRTTCALDEIVYKAKRKQ